MCEFNTPTYQLITNHNLHEAHTELYKMSQERFTVQKRVNDIKYKTYTTYISLRIITFI